jgi:hypothetical protein
LPPSLCLSHNFQSSIRMIETPYLILSENVN